MKKVLREYLSKLGKKGGKVGGKSRMGNLTPEERHEFAMMGVNARWGKRRKSNGKKRDNNNTMGISGQNGEGSI